MTQGRAMVLPPGSVKRIVLSGDPLEIKLLGYRDWEAVVVYPDGNTRHHQASTVNDLLDKITGQLKTRYNIENFSFKEVPQALEPSTIKIGEISYA